MRAVGVCRAPRKGKRGIGVWRRARAAWLCASPWLCEWAFLACEQVLPIHVSVRFPHAAAYTSARPAPPSTCLTCASVGWNWAGGGSRLQQCFLSYMIASPCRRRRSCLHNTNNCLRRALSGHYIRLRLRGPVVHANLRHSPATPTGKRPQAQARKRSQRNGAARRPVPGKRSRIEVWKTVRESWSRNWSLLFKSY